MSSIVLLFIVAEAVFCLTNSKKLLVLLKSYEERTGDERKMVSRGLKKEILLEALFFVPLSAWVLSEIFFDRAIMEFPDLSPRNCYAILGAISVGFPYASLKGIMKWLAFRELEKVNRLK